MRKTLIACATLLLVSFAAVRAADDQFPMPKPQKEHEWLKQLAGEWDLDLTMTEPGKGETKAKGSESTRLLGGFWSIADVKATMMNMPFGGQLTIGYSIEKKKYVATWVDSMGDYLWTYEGTLDPGGKILTLETIGPCPMQDNKPTRFKEIIEIKDKDHRTFKSLVELDGKFQQMLTIEYTRKAATAARN